ncbi:MAG TPA: PIN domain-containing protein, partial [Chloroflexota bacterium]|nr:PIN domain-containing protein [Chloroflexota bacterium]
MRLLLDSTILIKGISFPRLPYEILRLGLRGEAEIVVSPLVLDAARRNVRWKYPHLVGDYDAVIRNLDPEIVPDPTVDEVKKNLGLCRDEDDVPVALAAIAARVDYLVTNDIDLTVEDDSTIDLR